MYILFNWFHQVTINWWIVLMPESLHMKQVNVVKVCFRNLSLFSVSYTSLFFLINNSIEHPRSLLTLYLNTCWFVTLCILPFWKYFRNIHVFGIHQRIFWQCEGITVSAFLSAITHFTNQAVKNINAICQSWVMLLPLWFGISTLAVANLQHLLPITN